jgi:hypothetical protein
MAVDKEVMPILTNRLPKTIAERRWVGLLRRLLIDFALGDLSYRRRNLKLPREKIAVSEAEKKAEKLIKIIKRNILNTILPIGISHLQLPGKICIYRF